VGRDGLRVGLSFRNIVLVVRPGSRAENEWALWMQVRSSAVKIRKFGKRSWQVRRAEGLRDGTGERVRVRFHQTGSSRVVGIIGQRCG
jgi:hypothetical protein